MTQTNHTSTQEQMFYAADRRASELDQQFLEFVKDGLTGEELARNIQRRPALWGRWANWLDKLPVEARIPQDSPEKPHIS